MSDLVKMRRDKVAELFTAINEAQELRGKIGFVYALARTKVLLKDTFSEIQRAITDTENRRMALVKEYGVKDDNGDLLPPSNGHFLIVPGKQAEFEAKANPIMEEQRNFMEAEIEVELFKVVLEAFPLEGLNARQVGALLPLIREVDG